MTQLQAGSIVSLFHDGRQRLALVEKLPKGKHSDIRLILDPGKAKTFDTVTRPRSELNPVPDSPQVQAARARIKRVRASGEGLARVSRNTVEQIAPSLGRGYPVSGEPPRTLASRTAFGGYVDWSPELHRFLCGNRYSWALDCLTLDYPQYAEVWVLADAGYAAREIAARLDITESHARKLKFHAKQKLMGYFQLWRVLPLDRFDDVA